MQVKALLKRLIANANTYSEEPDIIQWISYNSSGFEKDKNFVFSSTGCKVKEEGVTVNYDSQSKAENYEIDEENKGLKVTYSIKEIDSLFLDEVETNQEG